MYRPQSTSTEILASRLPTVLASEADFCFSSPDDALLALGSSLNPSALSDREQLLRHIELLTFHNQRMALAMIAHTPNGEQLLAEFRRSHDSEKRLAVAVSTTGAVTRNNNNDKSGLSEGILQFDEAAQELVFRHMRQANVRLGMFYEKMRERLIETEYEAKRNEKLVLGLNAKLKDAEQAAFIGEGAKIKSNVQNEEIQALRQSERELKRRIQLFESTAPSVTFLHNDESQKNSPSVNNNGKKRNAKVQTEISQDEEFYNYYQPRQNGANFSSSHNYRLPFQDHSLLQCALAELEEEECSERQRICIGAGNVVALRRRILELEIVGLEQARREEDDTHYASQQLYEAHRQNLLLQEETNALKNQIIALEYRMEEIAVGAWKSASTKLQEAMSGVKLQIQQRIDAAYADGHRDGLNLLSRRSEFQQQHQPRPVVKNNNMTNVPASSSKLVFTSTIVAEKKPNDSEEIQNKSVNNTTTTANSSSAVSSSPATESKLEQHRHNHILHNNNNISSRSTMNSVNSDSANKEEIKKKHAETPVIISFNNENQEEEINKTNKKTKKQRPNASGNKQRQHQQQRQRAEVWNSSSSSTSSSTSSMSSPYTEKEDEGNENFDSNISNNNNDDIDMIRLGRHHKLSQKPPSSKKRRRSPRQLIISGNNKNNNSTPTNANTNNNNVTSSQNSRSGSSERNLSGSNLNKNNTSEKAQLQNSNNNKSNSSSTTSPQKKQHEHLLPPLGMPPLSGYHHQIQINNNTMNSNSNNSSGIVITPRNPHDYLPSQQQQQQNHVHSSHVPSNVQNSSNNNNSSLGDMSSINNTNDETDGDDDNVRHVEEVDFQMQQSHFQQQNSPSRSIMNQTPTKESRQAKLDKWKTPSSNEKCETSSPNKKNASSDSRKRRNERSDDDEQRYYRELTRNIEALL